MPPPFATPDASCRWCSSLTGANSFTECACGEIGRSQTLGGLDISPISDILEPARPPAARRFPVNQANPRFPMSFLGAGASFAILFRSP